MQRNSICRADTPSTTSKKIFRRGLLGFYLGSLSCTCAPLDLFIDLNKFYRSSMVEPSYNFWFDAMAFPGFDAAEADLEQSRPLNAKEAQDLRRRLPSLSPWGVIVGQCLVGMAVVLLTWLVSGDGVRAWSVAYGALVVVLPAAVFARGLKSQFSSLNVITAGFGFFFMGNRQDFLERGYAVCSPRFGR